MKALIPYNSPDDKPMTITEKITTILIFIAMLGISAYLYITLPTPTEIPTTTSFIPIFVMAFIVAYILTLVRSIRGIK